MKSTVRQRSLADLRARLRANEKSQARMFARWDSLVRNISQLEREVSVEREAWATILSPRIDVQRQ